MPEKQEILEIKEHTKKKYSILSKYLGACQRFQNRYNNFVYIDTHGGSGKVLHKEELIFGSPLIAATTEPIFPCHVVEINDNRFEKLKEFVKEFPNIKLYKADCNKLIDDILANLEDWKFKFCFLDPSCLKYEDKNTCCSQLLWETVEKISKCPKTELFINFPLEAIIRNGGYCLSHNDQTGQKMGEWVTKFFGGEEWKEVGIDIRKIVRLYISKLKALGYQYDGAILIRSVEKNLPLYYLVYATHHPVGAKIMRGIMKRVFLRGQTLLPTADFEKLYPLDCFIFESRRRM